MWLSLNKRSETLLLVEIQNPGREHPLYLQQQLATILDFADQIVIVISFVNRENRVPHYQRLFQRHDGLRQWNKVSSFNTFYTESTETTHLCSISSMNITGLWSALQKAYTFMCFQTPRSRYLLFPYYVALWGGFGGKSSESKSPLLY